MTHEEYDYYTGAGYGQDERHGCWGLLAVAAVLGLTLAALLAAGCGKHSTEAEAIRDITDTARPHMVKG